MRIIAVTTANRYEGLPDVLTVADTRWTSPGAPKADGLVTDRPGVVLGVLAADCAPVLLADSGKGVIGACHAGWKGALGGVVEATISAMAKLGARREQRGLAYNVSSFAAPYMDGGLFAVYAGTGEKETPELVQVLFEQLRGTCTPAPEAELQRARTQMRAGVLMSLESPGARMEALGTHFLVYGRPIPVEEILRKIQAGGGPSN